MKVIYNVIIDGDEDIGEVEGFFLDNRLLATWAMNDANWRGEYMDPLLKALGYTVKTVYEPESILYQALKKHWT